MCYRASSRLCSGTFGRATCSLQGNLTDMVIWQYSAIGTKRKLKDKKNEIINEKKPEMF